MKKICIRFLRQGLIEVEVPEGSTPDEVKAMAEAYMEKASDSTLKQAMSDFPVGSDDFFDEPPMVAAIELPANDYDLLFTSSEWEAFRGSTPVLQEV